ncbi:MAG: hypothetical protein JNG82_01490 [Opitutaceae bacterium]|nr:hypothetical protein [Opitutaceae bacterium]
MTTDSIISKVWSSCHTLRDDGVATATTGAAHLPQPPQAQGDLARAEKSRRPPAEIHACRADRARQNQPRPLWLKDDSLADLDNLPEPEVHAEEIIENVEAGLNNFRAVVASLSK